MTSVRIVSTEPCGDLIAVMIEVESEEIFTVNGKVSASPDRSSEYHQSLHTGRVEHAHHKRLVTDTIYIKPPFSEEKVADQIAAVRADVARTRISDFSPNSSPIQERCYVNGEHERAYFTSDGCPDEVINTLTGAFPGVDPSRLGLISSPSYHEVMKQNIISTFPREGLAPGQVIDGMKVITRSRKFCVESGWIYDKIYALPDFSERFKFIPSSCRVLAKSTNLAAPGTPPVPDFYDVYFGGGHTDVQRAFNLDPRPWAQQTYYGVTVYRNEVVRLKQYCYDTPGMCSNWDDIVRMAAEAHGVELPTGMLANRAQQKVARS